MSNSADEKPSSHRHPRYWPTWFAILVMRFIGRRRHSTRIAIGRCLGGIAYFVLRRRRHIVEVNIGLCFPELTVEEKAKLVKESIVDNILGFVETMGAWWGDLEEFEDRIIVEGANHLLDAIALGRGVILVGAHYTTLDFGTVMIKSVAPVGATYRAHNNPLMDKVIRAGRLRNVARVIDRNDMRGMIRSLKNGEVLWYAPDQDYGARHSVFAPFFGVPAASLKMTSKLAKLNNSRVVMVSHHRDPDDEHYRIRFRPALEDYPTGDDITDATTINQALEKEIRLCPSQYMWVHRRFKSRPKGEPSVY